MIFLSLVLLMAITIILTVLSFMNPEFRIDDSMTSRKKMIVKRNLLSWRIMSAAAFVLSLIAFICANVLWS
jgi:hypothetical protein